MGVSDMFATLIRIVLGGLFIFIGVYKFLSLYQESIPATNKFFEMTIGPQPADVVEYSIKGVSLVQAFAGMLIGINATRLGGIILAFTLAFFLSTSYNIWIVGFNYENITLFANECSLFGICIMMIAYAGQQVAEQEKDAYDSQVKSMINRNKGQKAKTD